MNERINTVIRRLLIIDYKMSIYFVQSQYGQYRSGNKSRSFDRLEGAKAHEYLRVHKGLSFITTVTNDPDGEAVFIEVPDKFRKEVISEKNHRHYVKAAIKGSNIEAVSFQQLFSEKEELTYEDIIASPFANVEDIVIRKIDRETLRLALCTLSAYELMIVDALFLSDSPICDVKDGFNFLSQTFIKRGKYAYSYPSDDSVERFISNIKMTISNSKKSQRDLIIALNQKLRGWANFHKYSEAKEAFRRVDTAVQTALLEAAMDKHPKWARGKVINKYWYTDPNGHHIYCLPEDKSVRVIKIAFTMLAQHEKVKTNLNPFLENDYIESRAKEKRIQNVVGGYRSIWEKQNGRCYYCGRPILIDQPKAIVQLFGTKIERLKNKAYIHKMCALNDFQLVKTIEDVDLYRSYDVLAALHEIELGSPRGLHLKPREIESDWKYIKLKDYFADAEFTKRTLSFKQIESILGEELPKSAYSYKDFWTPRRNMNRIAEAWLTEGYHAKNLDLKKKRIQFVRDEVGTSQLFIPNELLEKRIPDNAAFELEQFFKYIIKKYAI